MKSLLALSFLMLLSSCGESRTRTLAPQEAPKSSTNALEVKTTKKCTTEAALKLIYSDVIAKAKKDRSDVVDQIYSNNSQQFNSIYSDQSGSYMETIFFIEIAEEKLMYRGKMNLSTCEVVSIEGTKAQLVDEEGNQL